MVGPCLLSAPWVGDRSSHTDPVFPFRDASSLRALSLAEAPSCDWASVDDASAWIWGNLATVTSTRGSPVTTVETMFCRC